MKIQSKIRIHSLVIILLFSSCDFSKSKDEQKIEIFEQNCSVENATEKSLALSRFLESEDYISKSKIVEEDFSLSYRDSRTFKLVEKITYKNSNFLQLEFVKKSPIKGNFYPKFRIIQMCFDSDEKAQYYFQKFNQIIKQQEKNYGYVLINKDKLYYFQTGVNMYSFILNDYKNDFQNIICD